MIDEGDAIVMWKRPYDPALLAAGKPQPIRLDMKPIGVWYALGDAWLEWCRSEMPGWLTPHVYRLHLDRSRILHLQTVDELLAFGREYRKADNDEPLSSLCLDWARLRTEYAGIEIAPYQWDCRFELTWYYGWDVASGCIWDRSAIGLVEPVELPDRTAEEGAGA